MKLPFSLKSSSILLSLLLSVGFAQAQNAGPSAAETKLKDMVKSLTQRVTAAEAANAAMQAEKLADAAKIKDFTTNVEKLTNDLKAKSEEMTKLREDSAAKEASMNSEIARLNGDIKAHQENLEKWRTAHLQISDVARKKEAERAKQAAIASATTRRVEDLRARNAHLFATGNEILDRYKKFGFGEALAAREPFTGNMRAKLNVQVQEFSDSLLDGTEASKRPVPMKAGEVPKAEAPKAEAPKADAPKADAKPVAAPPVAAPKAGG